MSEPANKSARSAAGTVVVNAIPAAIHSSGQSTASRSYSVLQFLILYSQKGNRFVRKRSTKTNILRYGVSARPG